jgi:hypothetical protein
MFRTVVCKAIVSVTCSGSQETFGALVSYLRLVTTYEANVQVEFPQTVGKYPSEFPLTLPNGVILDVIFV